VHTLILPGRAGYLLVFERKSRGIYPTFERALLGLQMWEYRVLLHPARV
jgi:hypothetical protein